MGSHVVKPTNQPRTACYNISDSILAEIHVSGVDPNTSVVKPRSHQDPEMYIQHDTAIRVTYSKIANQVRITLLEERNVSRVELKISVEVNTGSRQDPETGTHRCPLSATARGGMVLYCVGVLPPLQCIEKNDIPFVRRPAT